MEVGTPIHFVTSLHFRGVERSTDINIPSTKVYR